MSKRVLMFFLILILSISLSNAIKTIIVDETELVSLTPKARDEDADRLFYSFTEPLDEGGKWQTTYGDAGEYTITVTASDGELSTSKDILLVIKKKNVRPTIDSFTPTKTELTIDEGEGINFNVKASDLNKDVLKYTWRLDNKIISKESAYSYKADYRDAGQHKIKVIVSDGEEEKDVAWTITVNKVDRKALLDNINDIIVGEGETIKLALPDFKKYNLEYTISDPIGNDNYWGTTYDDEGVYNIKITISDRLFSASKTIKVKVIDKDRPPTLKPIANAWLKENQKVIIELEAYDPDNDGIRFYAENLPDGAFLRENRFEWVINYNTLKKDGVLDKVLDKFHLLYKPFKITFIAQSKELEAKQSVLIMVKDVNMAPVLNDIPTIIVNEGEEAIIKPEANDPDGDNIIYSYSGWIDIDRYTTNYDDAGTYKVKVIVADGFLTDEKYATIIVKDVNRAPVFQDIGKSEINENEKLELSLYTTDPEGDSVEIISESLPRNSSIEDNIFTWTPDYDTVNTNSALFTLNFIANDGKDQTIKQANITVYNVNRAPKITSASKRDITVKKGRKVKFEVVAEDPDGDELNYLWKFSLLEQYKADSAMMRTFTSPGNKKVKVVVSDGEDKAEYVFNVKVI